MEIVNKAIAKASDLASEAAWNAQQRLKVNTEEKRLGDLRSRAFEKRAEIGEQMFRLWQAHKLPPSQLDAHFYELRDLVDAVDAAAQNLDAVRAETYEQATTAQAQTATSYAAAIPVPPAQLVGPDAVRSLSSGQSTPAIIDSTPAITLVECSACHAMVRADRNFCGHCGQPLR